MEKFIKENWFKISIIVILVAVAVYYFTILVPHGRVSTQENCSKKASEFFLKNTLGYDNMNYTNHYNSKMEKCFILITGGDLATEYHAILYNAYDNKEIGGIHTAGQIAGLCGLEINDSYKTCEHLGKEGYVVQAFEEFDNLIKVYMEN